MMPQSEINAYANEHRRRTVLAGTIERSVDADRVREMRDCALRHQMQQCITGCFAEAERERFQREIQRTMNLYR